ncbi:MAG: hypothetical protein ACTSVB_03655, partial [Candidatus Heimdallarchaeaceae archaeon]
DGECFRYRDWPFGYEKCYFYSSYYKNACDSDSSLITCGSETDCDSGVVWGTTHDYIDTSSAAAYTGDWAHSSYLVDCGTGSFADYWTDDAPDPVYVINKKRFHCLNSTHYTYQGWYGSGWVNYAGGECSGACDDSGAQNYTSSGDNVPNPCFNSTDLIIVDIIPIQVIPNVDMIQDKSGYIRVIVYNNGSANDVNAKVTLDIIGISVTYDNTLTKSIDAYQNQTFDFSFKPRSAGNANVTANVTIVS